MTEINPAPRSLFPPCLLVGQRFRACPETLLLRLLNRRAIFFLVSFDANVADLAITLFKGYFELSFFCTLIINFQG